MTTYAEHEKPMLLSTQTGPEEGMHRCAILDDYQNVALKYGPWDRLAGRVEVQAFDDHVADPERLASRLAEFDIVVAMRERTPFDRGLIERLPNLKLLITTGAANASFDVKAAEQRGITVCGTRSIGTGPTAELTFALILALSRGVPIEAGSVRAGGWQLSVGTDLAGARLGLLGLGRIGTRVARIAAAFEMKVAAWSPNLTQERCRQAGCDYAGSIESLFAESDFISVHLVLGATTRGIVGARELSRMKPTARIINTSRGPIIDEASLIAALEERRIAGAALDVYDSEPLALDHPFRRLDTVLATPHIGYVTEGNYRVYFTDAVEDIEAWLAGSPVRTIRG